MRNSMPGKIGPWLTRMKSISLLMVIHSSTFQANLTGFGTEDGGNLVEVIPIAHPIRPAGIQGINGIIGKFTLTEYAI